MAKKIRKKEVVNVQDNSSNRYLTKEEYWMWRASVAELQLAEKELSHMKNVQVRDLKDKITQLQIQLNNLVNGEGVGTIKGKTLEIEQKRKEHLEVIKKIEERVGYSLKNSSIDDVTLEIKEIQDLT